MTEAFDSDTFTTYYFTHFACFMVDVSTNKSEFWKEEHPKEFWDTVILGTYYVSSTPTRKKFITTNNE